MRHALATLAAVTVLSGLAQSPAAQAQTIIATGDATVFISGNRSRMAASIDQFGNLTLVAPPQAGGPFLYNPRTGTLTGPGFQTITIPGQGGVGLPLIDPVFLFGF
ncbi:hypothetical protein [Fundidesulfovibrio terrae]|uniref:hypothetical protein n=1 Tax=Fundidesulfovibrio terrae TaxID=2922866 RepID=UPI001FAFE57B|nr:hypothetical protein [Fundidesulfovibrio terrae]